MSRSGRTYAPAGLRPEWEREGRDWPNREHSRFVAAAGRHWHVQLWGSGPVLLLAHGTAASTHSWRGLAPLLAEHFTVVAPDLPGHGFTEAPLSSHLSLSGMARGLGMLLKTLALAPDIAVGHSAGAAVLARMCLDQTIAPRALVSLNGALLPMHGTAGHVFAPLAKLLASVPLVPLLMSWRAADRSAVERLIRETGSTIEPEGIDYYARLLRRPAHVRGALGMMAQWDLRALARDLPRLRTPLTLLVGDNDRAIPPSQADRVRALVPGAVVVHLPGTGHLSHEERPDATAGIILDAARRAGLRASA